MMNHIVPDFETDENYLIPDLPKKSSTMAGDEDIMELLWQNGQVVMQSQNQRSIGNKRPEIRSSMANNREIRSSVVEEETGPSGLFMQEDEMSAWLHYPMDENSLEGYFHNHDLLYPTPPPQPPPSSSTAVTTALPPPPPPPPPVPPFRRVEGESGQQKYTNFLHFSRPRVTQLGPSSSKLPPALKPATVTELNDTAAEEVPESRVSRVSEKSPTIISAVNIGVAGISSSAGGGRDLETCELSVTSSPGTGGSEPSSSQKPSPPPPAPSLTDDRKRKGRDTDDTECHSEDVEFEYPDAKKQSHGATSTKRSRAAEVHNLSERRRRDRINEKMKALQELIPRCNKSDKASMLDEAIEYLKSLQTQVQMMSMGCSMVPMMFPGVQQYMSPMSMGMGMGMGMDMGMNRSATMVPYPAILPGSSMPNPTQPQFPVAGFNMPPPPPPVTTITGGTPAAATQGLNLSAPIMTSFPLPNQNQPRPPNFADPFQRYLGLHPSQLPLSQNQGGMPPIATKPSSSKDPTNQTGISSSAGGGRDLETCELSVTSSPGTGGSEPSSSQKPSPPPPAPSLTDDRKRKGRDTDDTECHSEDVEFEYPDAKKQSHGATSTKRSRAAEVHNLSERRRRDRINEKMKALQELIPRCNKSDKASMLDEAIEYLKSLQTQVQMMSMGCSMVPMMFPGVQQYMSPMSMGMGMGMGMDMGMNRSATMVPYPAILPGSSMPNPTQPQFPVAGFNMPPPPPPVTTITGGTPAAATQGLNLSAPIMTSFPLPNQNQPRPPNFADPFQRYLGLHPSQLPLSQNQGGMPPIATKPSSSKDPTNQTG